MDDDSEQSGEGKGDGAAASDDVDADVRRYITEQQRLHAAWRPRSLGDALRNIRQGLALVASQCEHVRNAATLARREAPEPAKFDAVVRTKQLAALEYTAMRLLDAVANGNAETWTDVERAAMSLARSAPARPYGYPPQSPPIAARWLRLDLDRIKSGGFAEAIRAQQEAAGKPVAVDSPLPATRWNVAGWIAAQLRDYAANRSFEERQAAIYNRMPLGTEAPSTGRVHFETTRSPRSPRARSLPRSRHWASEPRQNSSSIPLRSSRAAR